MTRLAGRYENDKLYKQQHSGTENEMTEVIGRYSNDMFYIEGVLAGEFLRKYREEHLISQTDASINIGIQRSQLCNLEKGYKKMTIRMLEKILRYYCLKPELEVGWYVRMHSTRPQTSVSHLLQGPK